MDEQELKLGLVNAAHLDRLLAVLPAPEKVVEQTNHYFVDPGGRTTTAGVMVRVREARDGAGVLRGVKLTLKRRTSIQHGVFLSEEIEESVDPAIWRSIAAGEVDLADAPLQPITTLCAELSIVSLRPHGAMVNTRHCVHQGTFLLEVDRTTFPDGSVDAEVEVETDDPEGARALVHGLADQAGDALFVQTKGKYQRFCERSQRPS